MMMMSWTNTSSFVGGNVFMRADLPHTCLNPTFTSAVLEFIVLVSIPEAFRGPAPSYPIWPFKSSFPTKITPVLWPVTCGCVVWSAEAQGLPPLSVVPICGTELPLCSHSKHSSRTTAFLSACELKLFLSNELLLRLFFFDTTQFYLYLCSSKCMISCWLWFLLPLCDSTLLSSRSFNCARLDWKNLLFPFSYGNRSLAVINDRSSCTRILPASCLKMVSFIETASGWM